MDRVYKDYKESLKKQTDPTVLMEELGLDQENDTLGMGVIRKEVDLTPEEKQYLLAVERGDLAGVKKNLEEAQIYFNININCVDPLGRTALLIAIENENLEMIDTLLGYNVELGDAILHAISEENVAAVEMLLMHQAANKKDLSAHLGGIPSSSFTSDITPIILAAHKDNYEIIKILLDRGDQVPKPHDARCHCRDCMASSSDDGLRHSKARINAYKALASPSLIALSSKDPVLTAFELCWELRRLSRLENEFKEDYEKLTKQCQEFATALLEQVRDSRELHTILNHDTEGPVPQDFGDRMTLSRLKLAIKYKQKMFVAHPHCQQLLAGLWYEGLPGFRRKHIIMQAGIGSTLGMMFPALSFMYYIAPKTTMGGLLKKPFVKFIAHSFSYLAFLGLLVLASQKSLGFGNPWVDPPPANMTRGPNATRSAVGLLVLASQKNILGFENIWLTIPKVVLDHSTGPNATYSAVDFRGVVPSPIEWLIVLWVIGFIWAEIKQLWSDGIKAYIMDMWNMLDFITNSLYVATIALRIISYMKVREEIEAGDKYAQFKLRMKWDPFDPHLISEALFAAANIFSQLKLVYIFTINPHLGPLQISLGRMIGDISKFLLFALLLLASFACGMNQLLWTYAVEREVNCEKTDTCTFKDKYFSNIFEITQTLYWTIFGLVELDSLDLEEAMENSNDWEKEGQHHLLTEFSAKLMFGAYNCIMSIVLINMLIAMMSTSYTDISQRSDREWKFARSKLWMSYFDEGGTIPVPFNIIPSPKSFYYLWCWAKDKLCTCTQSQKRNRWQSIRRIVKKVNDREARYQIVMKDLIKRYIMHKQRRAEDEGVTEDDLNEIKQDISAFRYELLEVLRNNGMKVPQQHNKGHMSGKLRRKRSQMTFDRLTKALSNIEKIDEDDEGLSDAEKAKLALAHSHSAPESVGHTNNISRHDIVHPSKARDSAKIRKADLEQKLPKNENLRRTSIVEAMEEEDEGKGSSKNSTPEPPSGDTLAQNAAKMSKKLASSMEELLLEKEEPAATEEVQLDPSKLPGYNKEGGYDNMGADLPFGKRMPPAKRVAFLPGKDKPPEDKKEESKEEKKYVYDGKKDDKKKDDDPPPDEIL